MISAIFDKFEVSWLIQTAISFSNGLPDQAREPALLLYLTQSLLSTDHLFAGKKTKAAEILRLLLTVCEIEITRSYW